MDQLFISPSPAVRRSTSPFDPSLAHIGVTAVEKVIQIAPEPGRPAQLFYAQLDCFVHLGPTQVREVSDVTEIVNEAIGEVILGEVGLRAEQLAQHIAERVRERAQALRAEVTIAARYPEYKPAPVSGIRTQEIYTLYGSAASSERGTRRIIGVSAQGMMASPSTQQLVADGYRQRLGSRGFSEGEIRRILDAVPIPSHDQRGLGTLNVGCPESCDVDLDAAALLEVIEDAMSSEIYELMKRSDEGVVVEKAHLRPRSVDDSVREMLRGAVERFGDLPDDAFLSARQDNLETVHQHNVVAAGFGLLGELRQELSTGARLPRHTSMREWLDAVDAG
jgi:GTP cyclohydrolase-4